LKRTIGPSGTGNGARSNRECITYFFQYAGLAQHSRCIVVAERDEPEVNKQCTSYRKVLQQNACRQKEREGLNKLQIRTIFRYSFATITKTNCKAPNEYNMHAGVYPKLK
jgi:hypothetical protein